MKLICCIRKCTTSTGEIKEYAYILESRNHAFPVSPHRPSHMLIGKSDYKTQTATSDNMFSDTSWTGLLKVIIKSSNRYENFANTVEEEEFMELYKYATSKPHGFLYIHTDPNKRVRDLGVVLMSTFILKNKSD